MYTVCRNVSVLPSVCNREICNYSLWSSFPSVHIGIHCQYGYTLKIFAFITPAGRGKPSHRPSPSLFQFLLYRIPIRIAIDMYPILICGGFSPSVSLLEKGKLLGGIAYIYIYIAILKRACCAEQ